MNELIRLFENHTGTPREREIASNIAASMDEGQLRIFVLEVIKQLWNDGTMNGAPELRRIILYALKGC